MKKSKYWQTALLLNLFFLLSCFAPTQISAQTTVGKKLTPREIAQQTLPSTVLIVMGNSGTKKIKSGSGFFVAEDIVATNFHVIKDTTEGYAKIYGQEKIYKILGTVGIDEKNDLALLKISSIKGKPLKLNTDDLIAIGDEVFAVGNPEGLEGTFSQGIVSSIRKTDKFNLLQITASISEGSSGGAVLNDKAEVVGVAVGAIESGQSLNFAIPVSFLRSLIANQKSLVALSGNINSNENQSNSKNEQTQSNSIIKNNPLTSKSYRLPFKTPDTIQKNLLGKVKSVKESKYIPELKFDKWVIGVPTDTRVTIYNSDGYVEMFEKNIVQQPRIILQPTPTNQANNNQKRVKIKELETFINECSFDWAKDWGKLFQYENFFDFGLGFGYPDSQFTYRVVFFYSFTDNMVEHRILHKCATCRDFTLKEKIFIKYENDKITEFDSNGKIARIASRHTDDNKKYQYQYNVEGKEECRTVEYENGIKEYYNDGKLVRKERIKSYLTGTTAITEVWVYNEQKKVFELSEKTTKTETLAGIKQISEFPKASRTETTIFDKTTNLVIQFGYDKYEYEFDSIGNWIKKTELKEVKKFGKTYFEPSLVIKREIVYY